MIHSAVQFFKVCTMLLAISLSILPKHQATIPQAVFPSAVFQKIAPLDQAAFLSTWTITLDWTDMTGAVEYQYCYDKSDNDICDSSWISTGMVTDAEIVSLQAQTKYYWQVQASDGENYFEADDGDWWEFETGDFARFHVQLIENNISGYDWRPGNTVTVTLDDPSNGTGIDFTDSKTVDPYGTVIFYELNGIALGPGMFITMTDGLVYKTHTVIDLAVSGVDEENDIVWGTGQVGAIICAQYCQYNGCHWRRFDTIGTDGSWQVDYSVLGSLPEEQLILDLVPGIYGEMLFPDPDGDHTDVSWRNRERFDAHPIDERVDGSGWLEGATLTIAIDDPITPQDPDYSNSTTVIRNPGDLTNTYFNLDFRGYYDLKPGDIVTITDGTITKTHTVSELRVLNVDFSSDMISGITSPTTYVDVSTCGSSGCFYRTVISDSSGHWSANFSEVGDQPWEQTVTDILPGTSGVTRQWDPDVDATLAPWTAKWEVFLPQIIR